MHFRNYSYIDILDCLSSFHQEAMKRGMSLVRLVDCTFDLAARYFQFTFPQKVEPISHIDLMFHLRNY